MSIKTTTARAIPYYCLFFIAGILLDSLLTITQSVWLGILIGAAFLFIFGIQDRRLLIVGLALLVLAMGIWRHQTALPEKAIQLAAAYYNQQVDLYGIIVDEPEKRISQRKFIFQSQAIPGKILVTSELYPEYHYGDQLKISGRLRQPTQFKDFDYRSYLAKDKIYSVIYYPEIVLLAKRQGNWFYQMIFDLKAKLRNVIEQSLLPPQSTIMSAVFLGDKGALSQQLKEKLNLTGTRHIVAISGMHMIIMSQILLFLALAFGLWRGQAFYFVLLFLMFYILMIGAPSSAVRAGIMAGLLLLAQKTGRLRSAARALTLAAVIMLIANPLLLESDVGFQLSFIATLSIIYLKPILDALMLNWPNPVQMKNVLTMTLSAQLGTLPILILHFGQFSLSAPLVNLLILPFLPLVMILSLIVSFAGLWWLALAKVLAWPAWFLLTYFIKVVDWFSQWPFSFLGLQDIPEFVLLAYYLVLFLIIYQCSKTKNLVVPS